MKTDNKNKEELIAEIELLNKRLFELEGSKYKQDYDKKELNIIQDALDSTINGVIVTDMAGKIEYANPSFIKMLEYEKNSDVIGKYSPEIFATQKVRKFSDIENIIDRGEGDTQEFSIYSEDGSIFPVEVYTSIVTDKGGEIIGRMASFIDITERKIAEEENKKLSSEILKSEERERQRISKDLHDGVGQTILAAKLNFIAYQGEPDKHKDRFKEGLQFIDIASQELREICNDLYPTILSDHGIASTIRWFSRNLLELNNIETDLKIDLIEKLNHEIEVTLYRIIKEIFSNILKHSGANRVKIYLLQDAEKILLKIEDNGIGFSLEEAKKESRGYGISNIQQRVKEIGGLLSIESSCDEGTIIEIHLKNK